MRMKKLWSVKALTVVAMVMSVSSMSLITSSSASTSSGTSIYVDLNETLAGFNVNTSASNEFVLSEIMQLVWPSTFIVDNKLNVYLNKDLVNKVTSVLNRRGQQVVTYTLNARAQWSDGRPITADDFIYNWQALSGQVKFKDKGNLPYDAAGTTGYSSIATVRGSAPAHHAKCQAGSAGARNAHLCPNGKVVTVTFAKATPFADWQSLFGNIVPAHAARKVGFNTGFNINGGGDEGRLLSGAWYYVRSYNQSNNTVVLQKNPRYWGHPGKLDNIVFAGSTDDSTGIAGIQSGTFNVFEPISTSLSMIQQAQNASGVQFSVVPGLQFEHFDFNQANPYLAKLAVRQAIAYGTDRKALIAATVGQASPSTKPLDNRIFMNNQPQYVANGAAYDNVDVAKAKALLAANGFTMGSGGYFQPNFGPESGQDFTLSLTTTTGNIIRSETQQVFQAQMKAIGLKITILNHKAGSFFGSDLPNGNFDIAEFAWVSSPFATGNNSIYCSYTNTTNCASNWNHYASPAVDALLAQGAAATSPKAEAAFYNKVDAQLWADMNTLPLYQKPVMTAWSSNYNNILPNPSSAGSTWNAFNWTKK
jgi:peptide/nickel transport system substrate-binding protein